MNRFALPLCLLLLFPAPTLAQKSNDSPVIAASDCAGLGRACVGVARELKAARELIAGYEAHIIAANDRIALARQEIASLKELSALQSERATELEAVIAAEREAKAALITLKDEQEKRIANLEKSLKRSRRWNLIAGVAAGVAILIGISR